MTILYIQRDSIKPSYSKIHLQCDAKISKKCIGTWSSHHVSYSENKSFHQCHNCIRAKYASKAGKIGGKKAVESGQIKQFILAASTPEVRRKVEQTHLKRYGAKNPAQCPEIFAKMQRSNWRSQILKHWRTGVELTCTASYEVAFVNWCNKHQIDFDWQIPHRMPDGCVYNIDAFIKDGEFANTWIEIKGWFPESRQHKWKWFLSEHSNSQLWNQQRLQELGILRRN